MLALNEVKNEASTNYFGENYNDLTKEQRRAVDKAVPVVVSEAEPVKIGF